MMRSSRCHFTARASTVRSMCRPIRFRLGDVVAVAHPLHVLLDDRTAVELLRHIVGRGADELHPAIIRLLVRLAADERRQERMVNIDDPIRELLDELAAK